MLHVIYRLRCVFESPRCVCIQARVVRVVEKFEFLSVLVQREHARVTSHALCPHRGFVPHAPYPHPEKGRTRERELDR